MLKTDLRKLWQLVRVILFDKVVSIKRLFAFHQYRRRRHGALTLCSRCTGVIDIATFESNTKEVCKIH